MQRYPPGPPPRYASTIMTTRRMFFDTPRFMPLGNAKPRFRGAKMNLLLQLLLSTLAAQSQAVAVQPLVTAEEAARPDQPSPVTRGIFPGPAIKLDLPKASELARPLVAPFRLKIDFLARNTAVVDVAKVRVVYLKSPPVDLTTRMETSITTSGIDVAKVSLPPGRHTFLITAVDSNGDRNVATCTFTIGR